MHLIANYGVRCAALAVTALAGLASLGCSFQAAPPSVLPEPPLALEKPAPLDAKYKGEDLSKLESDVLLRRARQFFSSGNYRTGAQFQYQAVAKTGTDQYDLACCLAQTGDVDAAFYWLQVAGHEDGVDANWAESDADLERLRADPRWAKVSRYLHQCAAYWAAHGQPVNVVRAPNGSEGEQPKALLLWLHGSNTGPDFRADPQAVVLESMADKLKIAVVGVSGTVPFGKAKFNWSENPEVDFHRIEAALSDTTKRWNLPRERVILIGFSQGAQVGLEVAARHPEAFAGAIAIAPGAASGSHLKEVKPGQSLANSGFVIAAGAHDIRPRLEIARIDVEEIRGKGAKVLDQPSTHAGHSFPRDFADRLPEWLRFIEKSQGDQSVQ
jgi:predicted esterase